MKETIYMFNWKEELELGIESIDNQHKKLFDIGNKINELLNSHIENDYNDIIDIITQLKEYTIYHFKTEEDIFLKYNYPDYDNHKKEHEKFINYLDSIDLVTIQNNQGQFLKELLQKIVTWVFNHIITSDYMYKDFLMLLGIK